MYRVVKKDVFEIVVNEIDGCQLKYEVAVDNMPHALDMLMQWKPIAPVHIVRAGPADRLPVMVEEWTEEAEPVVEDEEVVGHDLPWPPTPPMRSATTKCGRYDSYGDWHSDVEGWPPPGTPLDDVSPTASVPRRIR